VRRDAHAEALEIGRAPAVGVTSGDLHSAPEKELGEGAHSRAGYADEVNGPGISLVE
jgi:hypothetical protein